MIFLDMDGVLCDFVTAAFTANGSRFDPSTYPRGLFECEKVLGVDASEFWRRIDFGGEAFWENLEPYPWAASLAKQLQEIDRVVIATSPSRSPASYSGKRRWLQKMGLCKLDSMFGSSKWLMSKTGRYLVDDGEHNTSKWNLQGGKSVLVPQPWNHATPVSNVVDYVCNELISLRAWSHHE